MTLLCACLGPGQEKMVTDLLKETGKEIAPDRRTAVFDVQGELRGNTLTLRGEIQSGELRDLLLRRLSEKSSYTLVDSLSVLPDPSLGRATLGVVSVSVANLRKKPDHPAELATQAILGTSLHILRQGREAWLLVQTPEGYLGWSDDHIVRMTPEEYQQWTARPKLIVTALYVALRSTPEPGSDPVSDLVIGAQLALVKDLGSTYQVALPDGREGFLPKGVAEPYAAWRKGLKEDPETIILTAKKFLGIPYLWGGTSSKALDCSGFTKTVFFLNGVLLPRDADQQALVGEPVDTAGGFASVEPGDLLFFGFRKTEKKPGRVTHVAISLGGRRFIHASSYVQVNSLSPSDLDYSSYRSSMFLFVRRIIGEGEQTGIRRLESGDERKP